MKKLYVLWMAMLCSVAVFSQVNITSLSTPYTQNFDGLASIDTSNVLPAGWLLNKSNSTNTYVATNGAANSGNVYSFGTNGNTERAFGTLLSNTVISTIGAYFTNNSGSTITSITLNYYGEKWRLGTANRVDSLIFQYSTNATSLTTGTYTTVNQLSYGVPGAAGTIGALDGNATANRTNITYTITGLSISPGTTFYFRWNDYNATSADDGLAIDDVTINFNGNTQPPCTAPTAQPTSITFSNVTTTSFNASFTAASPAADEYLAVVSTSSTLGGAPANGTVYNTDDAVGNGVVAYRGSGTTFSETNLTPGTTYYIFIFALSSNCSNGPVYLTASPATASQATTTPPICTAPAAQPTAIVVSSVTGNSISGSFTASATADSYVVTVGTEIVSGFTPVNGATYTVGSTVGNGHKVIKFGPGNTFTATSLMPNTFYYIYIYAFNNIGCTGGPIYNTSTPAGTLTQTNNNTSGIPANYYDTITTQTCAPLKSALKWRTTSGNTPKTYTNLWDQYIISDVKPREVGPGTSANVIWDVYSDNPTGNDPYNFTPGRGTGQQDTGTNTNSEGFFYNREHSVPLSWFGGNTNNNGPATDYLHIYPTDKYVNAQRSNYIYGVVTSPTYTSQNGSKLGPNAFAGLTGTAFEPISTYKGDLARSFLYFVTRYEDQVPTFPTNTEGSQAFAYNTYPSINAPYLALMIQWHNQDPVSQKEIDRNNAAYVFQGNRNPFIDHPEYVDRIWGNSCSTLPVQIVSFVGTLKGTNVILNWKVQNETNLLQYEVERSNNNRTFTAIGKVKANNLADYQFTDDIASLAGRRLYYRLKKVDVDGRVAYSNVFTVYVPANLQFTVYPNPVVNGIINVNFAKPITGKAYLQLTDASGKVQQQLPVNVGAVSATLSVPSLAAGIYQLQLIQPGSNTVVQKVQVL